MSNSNPFDTLGQPPEYPPELIAQFEKLDHLIHRTFQQSEDGQQLLKIWSATLMMTPAARPGDDLLTIGIEEGKKQFIRHILTTIQKTEKG